MYVVKIKMVRVRICDLYYHGFFRDKYGIDWRFIFIVTALNRDYRKMKYVCPFNHDKL